MEERKPQKRIQDFAPFKFGYDEIKVKEEATRCLHCLNPRCVKACPVHNRIPDFILKVKEDDIKGAYQILMGQTILPEICATVCPHESQCEGACVRGIKGESVNIGAIERYIAKYMRLNALDKVQSQKKKALRVACVGSGPAGLAFALSLAQKGVQVEIFEKEAYLGGVLTWGIPSYRLEKEAVLNIFKKLEELKVITHLQHEVTDLNELKDFDAIFLATGAEIGNRLWLDNEDLPQVYEARKFLEKTNFEHRLDSTIKNIMVVGGGNVAMDCARNALRLKGVENVYLVYRRSREEMPAAKEELKEALEEGVKFYPLTNPAKILGNQKLEKVVCTKMKLGDKDESGRPRPIATDETIEFAVDALVLALGFKVKDHHFDLKTSDKNLILVNEDMESSSTKVLAGGDVVNGALTVVSAMRDGLKAAKTILKRYQYD